MARDAATISSGDIAETRTAAKEARQTWWQWVRDNPKATVAIITAVLGMVPQARELYQSQVKKVPFGLSRFASEQDDAWTRNLACTAAPLQYFETEKHVKVDATICRSGDVLVRVDAPDGRKAYKWLVVDSALGSARVSLGEWLVGSAYAQSGGGTGQPGEVVCQKVVGDGTVSRATRSGSNPAMCVVETISTYSGAVTATRTQSCDDACR